MKSFYLKVNLIRLKANQANNSFDKAFNRIFYTTRRSFIKLQGKGDGWKGDGWEGEADRGGVGQRSERQSEGFPKDDCSLGGDKMR